MAEPPHLPADPEPAPHRFPPLTVDGHALSLRQRDAQTAVDAARAVNVTARRDLVTRSVSLTVDDVQARVAADDATAVLRAAVRHLTEISALRGVDVTPALEVDLVGHPDGVSTVARPHGEIDLFTAPRLEQVCMDRLDADPPPVRLLVDLSAVTFLDSSGMAVLVEIQRACRQTDTAFALTGLSRRIHRLLAITRLDSVFPVV